MGSSIALENTSGTGRWSSSLSTVLWTALSLASGLWAMACTQVSQRTLWIIAWYVLTFWRWSNFEVGSLRWKIQNPVNDTLANKTTILRGGKTYLTVSQLKIKKQGFLTQHQFMPTLFNTNQYAQTESVIHQTCIWHICSERAHIILGMQFVEHTGNMFLTIKTCRLPHNQRRRWDSREPFRVAI